MKFIRKGFSYYVERASPEQLKQIRDALCIRNPKAWFSDLYRNGEWDGFNYFFDKRGNYFPWGLLPQLIKKLKLNEEDFDVDFGHIVKLKYSLDLPTYLFKYQRKVLKKFFDIQSGILVVPTGGGKTLITAEAMANFLKHNPDLKICFIVDTVDLVTQSRKVFETLIGEHIKITECGNGKKDYSGQIVVTTIQFLQTTLKRKIKPYTLKRVPGKKSKKVMLPHDEYIKRVRKLKIERKDLITYMKSVGFLIIDELQECGSDGRINVLKKFSNTVSLLGLSATPFRKSDPVAKFNLIGFTGGIISTITEDDLKKEGVLAESCAILIEYNGSVDVEDLMEAKEKADKKGVPMNLFASVYERYIIKNEERNKIISLICKVVREIEVKTLCLFQSVDHGKTLSERLDVPFIYGEHSSEERDSYKHLLLKQDLNLLFASNIYNKGINLPEVKLLVNCGAGKSPENFIQKRGRVLRKEFIDKDDKAVLIDIMDTFETYFSDHSLERLKVLEDRMGIENILLIEWTGSAKKFRHDLVNILFNWFIE